MFRKSYGNPVFILREVSIFLFFTLISVKIAVCFSGDFSASEGAICNIGVDELVYDIAVDNTSVGGPFVYVVVASLGNDGYNSHIVKYDPDGSILNHAEYPDVDLRGIKLDSLCNVVVTGRKIGAYDYQKNWITLKYDKNLNFISSYEYRHPNIIRSYAVDIDDNDDIYVGGFVWSGNTHWHIRKYDSTLSSTLADATYDSGTGNEVTNALKVTASGDIVAAGYKNISSENTNWYVRKYDSGLRTLLGEAEYAGACGYEYIYDVALDAEENIIVTGFTYNGSDKDCLIMKYSPDLSEIISTATYKRSGDDYGVKILASQDDTIFVSGYTDNETCKDLFLNRYDKSLNIISSQLFESGYEHGLGKPVCGMGLSEDCTKLYLSYVVKNDDFDVKTVRLDVQEYQVSDSNSPVSEVNSPSFYIKSEYTAIEGTSTDDVGVERVDIAIKDESGALDTYWDGVVWKKGITWLKATGTESWTYTSFPYWTNGRTYSICSRATDINGNVEADITPNVFTYDAVPPQSTINLNDGTTYKSLPEVGGGVSDVGVGAEFVEIRINDMTAGKYWNGTEWANRESWVKVNADTSWKYASPPWVVGHSNVVTVKATDKAGNTEGSPRQQYFKVVPDFSLKLSAVQNPIYLSTNIDWSLSVTNLSDTAVIVEFPDYQKFDIEMEGCGLYRKWSDNKTFDASPCYVKFLPGTTKIGTKWYSPWIEGYYYVTAEIPALSLVNKLLINVVVPPPDTATPTGEIKPLILNPDNTSTIYAIVSDNNAVGDVTVYYRDDGLSEFNSSPMDCVTGQTYNTTLPAKPADYFVKAADVAGNEVAIIDIDTLKRFAAKDISALLPEGYKSAELVTVGGGYGYRLTMTWPDMSESGAVCYEVYRSEVSGELGKLLIYNLQATGWTDYSAELGKTYYYTIYGLNKLGERVSEKTLEAVNAVELVIPQESMTFVQIRFRYIGEKIRFALKI